MTGLNPTGPKFMVNRSTANATGGSASNPSGGSSSNATGADVTASKPRHSKDNEENGKLVKIKYACIPKNI